jgi:hypothetical protein
VACCISLRKTRIFTIGGRLSPTISLTQSPAIDHCTVHCQSPHSQLSVKATGVAYASRRRQHPR